MNHEHELHEMMNVSPTHAQYIARHITTVFREAEDMPDFITRVVYGILHSEPIFCGYQFRENAVFAGVLMGRYIQRNETANAINEAIPAFIELIIQED
jgi:hypothetical protein